MRNIPFVLHDLVVVVVVCWELCIPYLPFYSKWCNMDINTGPCQRYLKLLCRYLTLWTSLVFLYSILGWQSTGKKCRWCTITWCYQQLPETWCSSRYYYRGPPRNVAWKLDNLSSLGHEVWLAARLTCIRSPTLHPLCTNKCVQILLIVPCISRLIHYLVNAE